MKKFKFNKSLVTSEFEPDNIMVLWVQINDSKKITAIKEFDAATGTWIESTLIGSGLQPVEIDLATTTHFPGENEILDEMKTSGSYCVVYEEDEPVYGTLKVVAEDDTVTQEAVYAYEASGTVSLIHCERECVDGEWDTWSAS